MSTVDKKLMDQMFRFAKDAVVKGVHDCEGEDAKRHFNRTDAQIMRYYMERGMRTMPFEQRILSEEAFDKRALDLGRIFIVRQLGTWEAMSYERLNRESEMIGFPELLNSLVKEGLVRRATSTIDGKTHDVLLLTEEGKRLFEEQEARLDAHANELFENLTEPEKMQLYILLRKMMGTPACEAPDASSVHVKSEIA